MNGLFIFGKNEALTLFVVIPLIILRLISRRVEIVYCRWKRFNSIYRHRVPENDEVSLFTEINSCMDFQKIYETGPLQ